MSKNILYVFTPAGIKHSRREKSDLKYITIIYISNIICFIYCDNDNDSYFTFAVGRRPALVL